MGADGREIKPVSATDIGPKGNSPRSNRRADRQPIIFRPNRRRVGVAIHESKPMLATYNGRAVRVLARAERERRGPWQSVPGLAWLFLLDAMALLFVALGNLKAGRIGLREYLPAIHGFDALIGLAAVFSILSLFVAVRSHGAARNQGPDVAREKCVAAFPTRIAPTLNGVALRDWEALRLTPSGLQTFSAGPVDNLFASQSKAATSVRSRHALAA
jgi:uncharacterized membrane protein YuzA (DUF378 family)